MLELEVVWPVSACALAPLLLDDDNVGLTGCEQLPACTDATFAPCTIWQFSCFVHVHVAVVACVLLVEAEVVVEESFDARRWPVFEPYHVTAGSDDFAVDHRYFPVCFEQKLPVVFVHRNIGNLN